MGKCRSLTDWLLIAGLFCLLLLLFYPLDALIRLPTPNAWSLNSRFAKPGDQADGSGVPVLVEDLSLQLADTKLRCLFPVWQAAQNSGATEPWWQVVSPVFSLGALLEAPSWSLLRGSLTGLLDWDGTGLGGGFLAAGPSDSSQVQGIGLSLADCLDFSLSHPLNPQDQDWWHAAMAVRAGLGLADGRLDGQVSAMWSQLAGNPAVRQQQSDDWWLDRPPVGTGRLGHLQLVLGATGAWPGGETAGRLFGQLSLPRWLPPGWMAGFKGRLVLVARTDQRSRDGDEVAGADGLNWGPTPSQDGLETTDTEEAASLKQLGDLAIELQGRGASESWYDHRGEGPGTPWMVKLGLDWRPFSGLQASSDLAAGWSRLPWGKPSAGTERSVDLCWRGRVVAGDSLLGLSLDGQANWKRDGQSAWADDQGLGLVLRARTKDRGGYLRTDLNGGLKWLSGQLERFDLGMELGGCLEMGQVRCLLGLSAGLAAEPVWWEDPINASPSAKRSCGIRARLNLGLGPANPKPGAARISLKASAALPGDETAQRLGDWLAGAAGTTWDNQVARLLARLDYRVELRLAGETDE